MLVSASGIVLTNAHLLPPPPPLPRVQLLTPPPLQPGAAAQQQWHPGAEAETKAQAGGAGGAQGEEARVEAAGIATAAASAACSSGIAEWGEAAGGRGEAAGLWPLVPLTSPDSAPPYCPQYCTVRLPQRSRRRGDSQEGGGGQGEEEEKKEEGAAAGFAWVPARVLHVFRNHLDLAVLQLEGDGETSLVDPDPVRAIGSAGSTHPGSKSAGAAAACCDAELSPLSLVRRGGGGAAEPKDSRGPLGQTARGVSDDGSGALYGAADGGQYDGMYDGHYNGQYEGQAVLVLGHGLFGPAASWPAAATHGTLAKVCCHPCSPHPTPHLCACPPMPARPTVASRLSFPFSSRNPSRPPRLPLSDRLCIEQAPFPAHHDCRGVCCIHGGCRDGG